RLPGCPLWPPPGLPWSSAPSRSSSRPLRDAAAVAAFWWQTIGPPEQVVVPALQVPGWPVSQAAPPPGFPSSTWPSQSSSMPLQISVVALLLGWQLSTPLEQTVVPAPQAPGLPVSQLWPNALASSTRPSQLSSFLL